MQTIQIHLNIGHVSEHEACGSTAKKPTSKGHVIEQETCASTTKNL